MTIESNKGQSCQFYISRVGSLAGKPLLRPYTSHNSFAVLSDNADHDYAAMTCLYLAGEYRIYIHGSCQPLIRLSDVRKVAEKMNLINHVVLAKMEAVIKYKITINEMLIKTSQLINELAKLAINRR